MMKPREIELEESIIKNLQSIDIYPFSVIFTYAVDSNSGSLSITFYLLQDLKDLLNYLDYDSQCDKSGYTILEDYNTIIFENMALVNIYSKL